MTLIAPNSFPLNKKDTDDTYPQQILRHAYYSSKFMEQF
jgi:hypothetical protein